jgi:hypothetical protein
MDLPSLTDRLAGDLVYIRERLERSAVVKAEELVSDLLESASPNRFILHGDFSLRNMLDAGGGSSSQSIRGGPLASALSLLPREPRSIHPRSLQSVQPLSPNRSD